MKIELLKNAFRSTTKREQAAASAMAIVPRKRRHLPVAGAHFDSVNDVPVVGEGRLMALAAANFDPRRITRTGARNLVELLHDGGRIDRGDRDVMLVRLGFVGMGRYGLTDDACGNLLAVVGEHADESGSETRMLSVLNELVALRSKAA